jgi:hypothetical protein
VFPLTVMLGILLVMWLVTLISTPEFTREFAVGTHKMAFFNNRLNSAVL